MLHLYLRDQCMSEQSTQKETRSRYCHDRWKISNTFLKRLAEPDELHTRQCRLLWYLKQSFRYTLEPCLQRMFPSTQKLLARRPFRPLSAEYLIYHTCTQLMRITYSLNVLYPPWCSQYQYGPAWLVSFERFRLLQVWANLSMLLTYPSYKNVLLFRSVSCESQHRHELYLNWDPFV